MIHILAAVLMLLSAASALAQTPVMIISNNTDDLVGSRIVFAFKEALRRSASMTLTERRSEALIVVGIVSLPLHQGNATTYSAVWTMEAGANSPPAFLSHFVMICASARVSECSENLMAETDEQISRLRRNVSNQSDRRTQ